MVVSFACGSSGLGFLFSVEEFALGLRQALVFECVVVVCCGCVLCVVVVCCGCMFSLWLCLFLCCVFVFVAVCLCVCDSGSDYVSV